MQRDADTGRQRQNAELAAPSAAMDTRVMIYTTLKSHARNVVLVASRSCAVTYTTELLIASFDSLFPVTQHLRLAGVRT